MCGITGFVGVGDQQDLRQMVSSLIHRGPDDEGFFIESDFSVYMGHRRLTIRDIFYGNQPMKTKDEEIVVIFNGEIYNANELRVELEACGHVFRTSHSDTEVLLYGYREWGEDLTEKLNGMWAFAIFDRRAKRLFLSRDRFGQKPLFYTLQKGTFAFASELKAFAWHRNLAMNVSRLGIQKYCAHGYFPGNHTPYDRIHKLSGGCSLILDIENLQPIIKRYWSYKIEPEESGNKNQLEYWTNKVRELLEKSVRRMLVSDVPLGVFLSGGLDSSAIAFFAERHLKHNQLRTFSIGFSEPSFDETASAMTVSDLLETQHSVKVFSLDILHSVIGEVFAKLDEPLSDSSMMSYFLLCRHARQDVKVALGGDAGDELFAGYDTFRALQVANFLEHILPKPVHRGILALLGSIPRSHSYMSLRFQIQRLIRGIGHPKALWHPLWLGPISTDDIAELFGETVNPEEIYSEAIEQWEICDQDNLVDKSLQFYGNLFLQDQILVKVDRMSMMHGLEVRSPFLDIELVNCVCKIPHGYKMNNGQTKYILRKAMEPFLPTSIVWRKKMGFSAPLGKWLSDGSIKIDKGNLWGNGSQKLIQEKITQHQTLRDDHRLFLWNIYVLNEFMKKNSIQRTEV